MKPLLLILIIYNLQNYVSCRDDEKDSILFKSYPKKVHQSQMFNAKLINSARIMKTVQSGMSMKSAKKQGAVEQNLYTVFPKVATQVPDSPYFPHEFDFLHKHRIKKIESRRKRSAPDNDTTNAPPAKVAKAAVTTKPVDKPAKNEPKNTKAKENKPKVSSTQDIKSEVNNVNNPKVTKVTPAKAGSPVAKVVKKSKTRRGVLPRPGKHSKTNKAPRKVIRQGSAKKRQPLRNGTKVRVAKKLGQKGKRQLRKNRKRSRRNPNKVVNPNVTHKGPVASRRLVAARDAAAEDYPYMISIQKDDEHWCSGALLNRRLIISTANCFWKSTSISRLKVRAGSRHPNQGGQVAYVQEVMKHPWWSIRSGPDNDIALALVDRIIKFSHGVHGVDLPNRAMMPPFDDFWVTSFGSERRDGVYERHGQRLQVFHTHLMDHDKCNNITQRFGIAVSKNFICLTQYGRRSPCTRDTGAPAVSDGILWGLASWGIRKLCGTERYPAMFSYVAADTNMDFIINATRYLMSANRENPMLDRMPRHQHDEELQHTTQVVNPDYPEPGLPHKQ